MPSNSGGSDRERLDLLVAEARRNRQQEEQGYRAKALKMFPWVCARCGREFQGKKRRELTVHHKDHDHDNNPPDGSNWELLCIYCHENEHSRMLDAEWIAGGPAESGEGSRDTYRPFAGLDALLKKKV